MAINDIREGKLKKIDSLRNSGILPYPSKAKRTHTIEEALLDFTKLSRAKKEISIVGRIMGLRPHGKLCFLSLRDGYANIQGLLRQEGIGETAYKFFLDNFDIGDFVSLTGILMKTKKGEQTLDVSSCKILTKNLLPLPEKWHGLQDTEERYRKRYLDFIFNQDVKEKFLIRSKVVRLIRQFLDQEGFVEVETPILQPQYGGAEAKPFITHLNAFDMKMYLRIAPELYLKRLIVGGFEKVYEIGRVFRNEGVDRSHNPDFTMLEFYWAYADYKDNMKFTEKLFAFVLKGLFGTTKITYEGREIDFKPPWPRVDYLSLLRKHAGIDFEGQNRDAIAKRAKELGVKVEKGSPKYQIADDIYKKVVRDKIWEPTFIIHYPTGSIPLAKPLDENPDLLGAFQLVVAEGWELVKAFTELNDPVLQRKIFQDQERYFEEGMEDAQRLDEDFLESLEYGMPPTTGLGMGIDRLSALLTNSHSLREAILFPTMKPR